MDELSLLQDQITPFSTQVAFSMIEDELGLPIDEIFSEISPEPVAAASLGQVLRKHVLDCLELILMIVSYSRFISGPHFRYIKLGSVELDMLLLSKCSGLVCELLLLWTH